MDNIINFDKYYDLLNRISPISSTGKVAKVVGFVVESEGPRSRLGSICNIYTGLNRKKIMSEVMGFKGNNLLLMPIEDIRGLSQGSLVVDQEQSAVVPVGNNLLGRIVDGLGNPIDGKGSIQIEDEYPIYAAPYNPVKRKRIDKAMDVGIRAINGFLTVGRGQRLGIFAGSGVGKSVLIGMIARHAAADVNVIALIGERGREVNEFIEKDLGEDGLKKSVVVVATSDQLPLIRMRGAFIATAIAEYFRDKGCDVNLIMDSVTRFAMAQREVGLSLGEPPATKGYTPSVFTLLPKLLERAGTSSKGTITGFYTVLVEGDDFNEPIADAVRSILDGHIVLTRDLADQNHYPAIDILKSISRVMVDIIDPKQMENVNRLKSVMATYRKSEDLINIGAYVAGSNPDIDYSIDMIKKITNYLKQGINEKATFKESIEDLESLFS